MDISSGKNPRYSLELVDMDDEMKDTVVLDDEWQQLEMDVQIQSWNIPDASQVRGGSVGKSSEIPDHSVIRSISDAFEIYHIRVNIQQF